MDQHGIYMIYNIYIYIYDIIWYLYPTYLSILYDTIIITIIVIIIVIITVIITISNTMLFLLLLLLLLLILLLSLLLFTLFQPDYHYHL